MAKRKSLGAQAKRPLLFDLLLKDRERTLRVLDRHGIYFDPGTLLTLSSPLEKVAAYHGVPDKKKFLKDILARN